MNKERMYDRIKGTMYGVAIGDSLGAPAEFKTREEIQCQYGQIRDIMGGSLIGAKKGCGTDDTAMTLAVAEGIMKCWPYYTDVIETVGAEFVRWYCGEPVGLGATCGHAIEIASKNGLIKAPDRTMWSKAAEATHNLLAGKSGGNGTLMRTAPIALFYDTQFRDYFAWEVSKMTHYDDDAAVACRLYCEIISKLIRGSTIENAVSCLRRNEDYNMMVSGLMPAGKVKGCFTGPKPTGYVKDSFRTALWGWLHHTDFEDTLIAVVNLGGDADTTGAIVGGLAGAEYGYKEIPDRWINALDGGLKARLNAVALAAADVWHCAPD